VTASASRLEPLLREATRAGQVQAANINAPDQVVVSGAPPGLDALEKILARERIEHRRLDVPRAFHSALMGSAAARLAERVAGLELSPPAKPFLSSVTRRFETDPESIRRSLVDQLTAPVDFVDQVDLLLREGIDVFIECGPRGVLASLTKRIGRGKDADVAITTADDPDRPGCFALARVAAMLDARRASSYKPKGVMNNRASEQDGSAGELDPSQEDAVLTLLDGEAAAELMREDGFEAFWARTRPSVLLLIQGLWAAERGGSTIEPSPAPVESDLPPLSNARPLPTPEEVKGFLIQSFSAETGYPPELIQIDVDLEADLGIDTVKQAQVLGRVRDHFDIRTEEKLSLRDFPSVGHIMRYVEKELAQKHARSAAGGRDPAGMAGGTGSSEPRRSRVPVVDLTERRSKPPKRE
jgi:malonyl CoA-acyl carrier protein transacylase